MTSKSVREDISPGGSKYHSKDPESDAQRSLDECVVSWIELDNGGSADPTAYHRVGELILTSCRVLNEAEKYVEDRDIKRLFLLVREIVGCSPFINRMQTWPRGYQGDFETMEYIMRAENMARVQTLAHICEDHALTLPQVQMHRNKVMEQARLVHQTCAERERGARILSLGCGSCPDLQLAQRAITEREADIFLLDMDGNALSRARKLLPGISDRLTFIKGRIVNQLSKALTAPFDLILARELFNYLGDGAALMVLRMLWERGLKPGGKIFFANVDRNDPYRAWRSWFVSWDLNERSEEEIRSLCRKANIRMSNISIRRDETGLAHFVELRRP